jgi:hypothetical protein
LRIDRCTDLDDAKPNLLVCRSFGESLDKERREVRNVLVSKRSNRLRLGSGQVSQDPSAILDDDTTKDASHCICR